MKTVDPVATEMCEAISLQISPPRYWSAERLPFGLFVSFKTLN